MGRRSASRNARIRSGVDRRLGYISHTDHQLAYSQSAEKTH